MAPPDWSVTLPTRLADCADCPAHRRGASPITSTPNPAIAVAGRMRAICDLLNQRSTQRGRGCHGRRRELDRLDEGVIDCGVLHGKPHRLFRATLHGIWYRCVPKGALISR